MTNQHQTLILTTKLRRKAVLKMMKIHNLFPLKCTSICIESIDLSLKVKVLKISLIVKILIKNFKNSSKMNLISAKLIMKITLLK